MANFFPRWTNGLPLKVTACVGVVALASGAGAAYYFTQKYTRVGYRPVQPVSFSHAVHAGQLGMDCRYCHGFADVAAQANIPTTQSCMACHAQIRAASPKLEALWESGKTGRPVEWVRVHQVPDYASFNHAVHVRRGVGCSSCHGAVNEMEAVWQDQPMSMSWCLDCHRAPEDFLRPPSQVDNMKWKPDSNGSQHGMGRKFQAAWEVDPPVACGGCHR